MLVLFFTGAGPVSPHLDEAHEFDPLVIFSCADSDLCFAFAAIMHRALVNTDPFVSA